MYCPLPYSADLTDVILLIMSGLDLESNLKYFFWWVAIFFFIWM